MPPVAPAAVLRELIGDVRELLRLIDEPAERAKEVLQATVVEQQVMKGRAHDEMRVDIPRTRVGTKRKGVSRERWNARRSASLRSGDFEKVVSRQEMIESKVKPNAWFQAAT